jgi:N-acetylmuramoyl-L-alanine amidase
MASIASPEILKVSICFACKESLAGALCPFSSAVYRMQHDICIIHNKEWRCFVVNNRLNKLFARNLHKTTLKKSGLKKKTMNRKILTVVLGLTVLFVSSFNHDEKANVFDIVVIDAGHGGHDPGCNGGNSREKEVTLAIALKLGKLIEDSLKDVKVIYTRKSDKFIELSERSNIANKNSADLFISIHCNANDNKEANGTETYLMGLHKSESNLQVSKRENNVILLEKDYQNNKAYEGFDPNSPAGHIIFSLMQNAFRAQSIKFAGLVEAEFKQKSRLKSRGVKEAGFLVLWKSAMPGVLIETGFLSSEIDRKVLAKDSGQSKIAVNIFNALKKYKNSTVR